MKWHDVMATEGVPARQVAAAMNDDDAFTNPEFGCSQFADITPDGFVRINLINTAPFTLTISDNPFAVDSPLASKDEAEQKARWLMNGGPSTGRIDAKA